MKINLSRFSRKLPSSAYGIVFAIALMVVMRMGPVAAAIAGVLVWTLTQTIRHHLRRSTAFWIAVSTIVIGLSVVIFVDVGSAYYTHLAKEMDLRASAGNILAPNSKFCAPLGAEQPGGIIMQEACARARIVKATPLWLAAARKSWEDHLKHYDSGTLGWLKNTFLYYVSESLPMLYSALLSNVLVSLGLVSKTYMSTNRFRRQGWRGLFSGGGGGQGETRHSRHSPVQMFEDDDDHDDDEGYDDDESRPYPNCPQQPRPVCSTGLKRD